MAELRIDNERLNECIEMICDDYCIWPTAATSQETLNLHCQDCPLNNIHIEEYWEEREAIKKGYPFGRNDWQE